MATDNAAYMRSRRHTAQQGGKCGTCAFRQAPPGYKTCATCRASVNRSKRGGAGDMMFISTNWCTACQASGFHREGCPGEER